jgi:hypothetical protein
MEGVKLLGQRNLFRKEGSSGVSQTCGCQHHRGQAPGSGGLVNLPEAVLNAVNINKPKMLTGLDQTVRGQVLGLHFPLARMSDHRRRAATFPTLLHQRNVVSPSSFPLGMRLVREAHRAAGKGSGRKRTPPCNGVDRDCASQRHHPTRKRADFPVVFRHEITSAN